MYGCIDYNFTGSQIAAHYGNEMAEYTPLAELKLSDFFFDHSEQGRVLGLLPPTFL